MRRALGIAAALAILSSGAIVPARGQSSSPPVFRPAGLVSATTVGIPFNSVAVGMVELHVTVGKTGGVEDIKVVRELASVTEISVEAVKKWEFTPATLHGKPVTSQMTIAVVFSSFAGGGTTSYAPVEAGPDKEGSNDKLHLIPAQITGARIPMIPNATVTGGTVVLQVTVGGDGRQGLVRVILDNPSHLESALQTVKDWQFEPAKLNGKDVNSNVVLAFSYRAPSTTSY